MASLLFSFSSSSSILPNKVSSKARTCNLKSPIFIPALSEGRKTTQPQRSFTIRSALDESPVLDPPPPEFKETKPDVVASLKLKLLVGLTGFAFSKAWFCWISCKLVYFLEESSWGSVGFEFSAAWFYSILCKLVCFVEDSNWGLADFSFSTAWYCSNSLEIGLLCGKFELGFGWFCIFSCLILLNSLEIALLVENSSWVPSLLCFRRFLVSLCSLLVWLKWATCDFVEFATFLLLVLIQLIMNSIIMSVYIDLLFSFYA